jgi:cell wall-associated NlpC family hydrolase
MAKYLKQYGGSWAKALTAYNAGPGRVGGALPSETQHYISTILGGGDHNETPKASKTYGVTTSQAPTLTPGGEKTDTKGAVVAALLDKRKGMSLVSRMQEAISSGKYTTTTLPKVTAGKYAVAQTSSPAAGGGDAKARADAIDAKKMPYLWGGGHGGKVDAFNAAPLDCSGAVSAVLGINPRVSGEFTKWGKAGDGGSKGITVYANGHHVLMKINGHFFGTSASNPGGGAGWIKQSNISPGYLAGFTARHA